MLPAASADRELLQIVDSALQPAASRAGGHLACHRGCAVCCFGPFAISTLDVLRLRAGLAALDLADSHAAEDIRERADKAISRLSADFPGDAVTGMLADGEWDEARFTGSFHDLACPALDPDSGACRLYEYRPVACRTYGLPLRLNGEDLPPCPLCFRGASREDIEASRAEINTAEVDQQIDAQLNAMKIPSGRTVVAFALARTRR